MNFDYLIIFKCIGFVPSHYINTINLNAMSSFNIFSKFDFMCRLNVLLV